MVFYFLLLFFLLFYGGKTLKLSTTDDAFHNYITREAPCARAECVTPFAITLLPSATEVGVALDQQERALKCRFLTSLTLLIKLVNGPEA